MPPGMLGGFGADPSAGAAGGMSTPGMNAPDNDMALAALGQLNPKQPNPTVALKKIEQAYDLAHKLIMATLPQLTQWNPKSAKDAHAAARMLLNIQGDLMSETEIGAPPDLMSGFGMAGTPSPLGPSGSAAAGGGF